MHPQRNNEQRPIRTHLIQLFPSQMAMLPQISRRIPEQPNPPRPRRAHHMLLDQSQYVRNPRPRRNTMQVRTTPIQRPEQKMMMRIDKPRHQRSPTQIHLGRTDIPRPPPNLHLTPHRSNPPTSNKHSLDDPRRILPRHNRSPEKHHRPGHKPSPIRLQDPSETAHSQHRPHGPPNLRPPPTPVQALPPTRQNPAPLPPPEHSSPTTPRLMPAASPTLSRQRIRLSRTRISPGRPQQQHQRAKYRLRSSTPSRSRTGRHQDQSRTAQSPDR